MNLNVYVVYKKLTWYTVCIYNKIVQAKAITGLVANKLYHVSS